MGQEKDARFRKDIADGADELRKLLREFKDKVDELKVIGPDVYFTAGSMDKIEIHEVELFVIISV